MIPNILHIKPKQKQKIYSEIHIECIVYELSDFDEELKDLRIKCHEMNVMFITRRYNSTKYSNDRHYITSLPAFHIYVKEIYKSTIYPNMNPLKIIKNEMSLYKHKLIEQQRKIEYREKYYDELYQWIKSLFINKTALEKAEEIRRETKKETKIELDSSDDRTVYLSSISKNKIIF
jgi:hypothetical protein